MSYPFLYSEQDKAQAVVLFCIDFRFKDATLEFLKHELQLADLDIVALAGACKNIAAPERSSDFETAIKQFEISSKLHAIKKIILIDHADCGAYGGSSVFETSKKERKAHVVNLRKAKKILQEKFPDKKIVLYYVNLKIQEIKFEKI